MANYGLKKPYIAQLNKATGAYSNGMKCGKAVNLSVTPNYSEASLYGDDEQAEYEKSFNNASVTLGVTTLPINAATVLFGHTVSGQQITYKTTDESNYVGLGTIVSEIEAGVKTYKALILPCVKFSEAANEYSTKGDTIEFKTPSIEGSASGNNSSEWKVEKIFESASAAETYIQEYLGILPTT